MVWRPTRNCHPTLQEEPTISKFIWYVCGRVVMKKKYVLALLLVETNDENNSISGQTWLQKMIYVASKAHPQLECGFVPHLRGVYSQHLKDILHELEKDGLVVEKGGEGRQPICLTLHGQQEAAEAIKDVEPNVLRSLRSLKSVFNRLTYRELIVLSYTKFPEMLEKSELVDDYQEWRKKAALSMVKSGKISLSLGAHIYGTGVADFEDIIYSTI